EEPVERAEHPRARLLGARVPPEDRERARGDDERTQREPREPGEPHDARAPPITGLERAEARTMEPLLVRPLGERDPKADARRREATQQAPQKRLRGPRAAHDQQPQRRARPVYPIHHGAPATRTA